MRKFVLAASIVIACAPSAVAPSASAPSTPSSAASTPIATPTATPTLPAATVAPSATAPAGPTRYTSTELGYSLDLPAGWRRGVCSAGVTSVNPVNASELFVGVPEVEEQIGPGTQLVFAQVVQSQGLTPVAYLESKAAQPDVRVESVTLNGSNAARAFIMTTGVTYAYAIAARGWLYHIERPYFGTEENVTRQIISSLRVLDDATLGRAPTATPPPRSAEALADALATAFAKRDLSAIGETLEPCVAVAAVPGDGASMSRARYLSDVARQFAAGTSVQVRARPIEDGPYGRFVLSTWSTPGQPDRRADFVLRARGERWSIASILYRAPS